MRILVIVDMQNDFIDGSLGSLEAQKIVPIMVERMNEMADRNTYLIFTKDTHYDNYLSTQEGKNLPVAHCLNESEGWCINKEIASAGYNPNFLVEDRGGKRILKETFGSIELAELLKNNQENIEEIVLMGVCTDICVVSNALLLKAYMPETLITVDASCCAGVTPEKHISALETMKSCQINVINE